MEFPEGFNQLDLLESHGHMIPVGTKSGWEDEDEGDDDEDETCHTEARNQQQELKLQDTPTELILWAAEKNRVSDLYLEQWFSNLNLLFKGIMKLRINQRSGAEIRSIHLCCMVGVVA